MEINDAEVVGQYVEDWPQIFIGTWRKQVIGHFPVLPEFAEFLCVILELVSHPQKDFMLRGANSTATTLALAPISWKLRAHFNCSQDPHPHPHTSV